MNYLIAQRCLGEKQDNVKWYTFHCHNVRVYKSNTECIGL